MKSYRWTEDDLKQVKGGVDRTRAVVGVQASEKPGAAPSLSKLKWKSQLESAFALRLEVMRREGEIDGWLYEPFSFRLAEGKRYRVDFISWALKTVEHVDGSLSAYQQVVCYEAKGWHKNYRDALTHLKWAAQRFPFFQWKKVTRNGKTGFNIMDVVI